MQVFKKKTILWRRKKHSSLIVLDRQTYIIPHTNIISRIKIHTLRLVSLYRSQIESVLTHIDLLSNPIRTISSLTISKIIIAYHTKQIHLKNPFHYIACVGFRHTFSMQFSFNCPSQYAKHNVAFQLQHTSKTYEYSLPNNKPNQHFKNLTSHNT